MHPGASEVRGAGWYAGALTFEFHRFRFHFRSAGALFFPPYKSGNIVRGAFGSIFRKLVCAPECEDARTCAERAACPYARVFEPRAARGEGPSGLADWPRPFVFRAAHLDGRSLREGDWFHFDAHLFDVKEPGLEHFVRAFAELAREGLGPGRGRAELEAVDCLDLDGAATARPFDGQRFQMVLPAPAALELAAPARSVRRLRVRFVTPTELKTEDGVAGQADFGPLFARLRDRVSTLRTLYGAGPLEIDFRAMGQRAAAVRTVRSDLRWAEAVRQSSKTGERHPLSGFVGEVEYEGELAEFLPYLRLGKWVGVGRQTVWGKGELEVR